MTSDQSPKPLTERDLQDVDAELLQRMRRQIDIWGNEEPREDWWQYQRDFAAAFAILTIMNTRALAIPSTSEAAEEA